MYGRATAQPRPRSSELKVFPAPVGGWIANRNLAQPAANGLPQGAVVLDNFFPTATAAVLRRGKEIYATLGDGTKDVRSLFSYVVGNQQELYAATDDVVYDISVITTPINYSLVTNNHDALVTDGGDTFGEGSTVDHEVLTGKTNGNWVVIQFATTGGIFLVGVNGADTGFYYDGTTFSPAEGGTPEITFPTGSTLTTADLNFVWAYKNRLFFIQKDSLDAWYLDVDQIGGELKRLPLGGTFQRGGSLLFGATWSLDSGNAGGLSEQCIFVTTEGEVAVFQGANPGDASDWLKVGVYRIGRPLGSKAWIRAGGDIVIASSIGFVPLSQAIQRDYAALSPSAVSYPIEEAWNDAVLLRGQENWQCEIWPENQMVAVSPPRTGDSQPVLFVANARTGAWARYTNWHATCMEVFRGELYFGSTEGRIYIANRTGLDDGDTYTGVYMPLFEDVGSPASLKIGKLARSVMRSSARLIDLVSFQTDFDLSLPAAPDATRAGTGNEWGSAIWGESVWGMSTPAVINQHWQSVGGAGYAISAAAQVTSGSTVPLDAEIIRLEVTYSTAEIVT